MNSSQSGSSEFKANQEQQWDSVAHAWRKWWPSAERGAQFVSDALANAIGASEGQRLLDISTGIGEPAVTLAKTVGPNGSVVATDQSAGMLRIASERITEEGLSNVELVKSDTEVLSLPSSTFDGAVCRWGLMFLPDIQQALSRIRELLKPGAKFATVVWGPMDEVPFTSIPFSVAARTLDPPPGPPAPGTPSAHGLGDDGVLQSTLRQAGFSDVSGENLFPRFELDSVDEYLEWLRDMLPSIQGLLKGRSSEETERFWKSVKDSATAHCDETGAFRVVNTAPIAVGTKS